MGSTMGYLLYPDDEELGALDLYSRKPGAFTEITAAGGSLGEPLVLDGELVVATEGRVDFGGPGPAPSTLLTARC
ncbi:hypothetical protein ACWDTR_32625 [Streptomyces sp. NPDC003470]